MEEMDMDLEKEISEKEVTNVQEKSTTTEYSKILKTPQPGMYFDSLSDLYEYYRQYGKQEGFGIKKKTSRESEDKKVRFLTLSCSRAGKSQSQKKNYLNPNPLTKVECKARINGTILEDGKCKINSVVLEHNHGLSPQKSRFYLCNREITVGVQRKLELNDRAGISVAKNFQSFVVEAGGHDNVPFLEKDCRNLIEKARRLRLGVGDAEAIHQYFVRMQSKNTSFFYTMDLDDKSRIKNIFWADARSRALYQEFGDVVTFDTTYLTNKYDMPFAPFVGVNHHGQSILLGCALISSEDTQTFVWLFKTWLACMSGCAPNAIITDQDKAMKKAIEVVFPRSRHRWCLWHIMKKIPEKLSGYQCYKPIKKALKICVYNSFTKEEFERIWGIFINDFNLQDNVWLNSLYEERYRWVPAFVKDTFWAGMSTTQRSESMNAFFDGYVNSKTTLKQFVEQYDSALRNKIEKENLADFQSFSALIPCVTHFAIEKQFQVAYTNAKFKEFQKELTGKLYCEVFCVDESSGRFVICEVIFFKEGSKEVNFNVHFNKENGDVECSCGLFELKGILCKHAISILIRMGVQIVSEKYILPRWRKNLRRCHTKIKVAYDDSHSNPEAQRYHELQKKFDKVADWAVISDERFKIFWSLIQEFETKVNKDEAYYEVDWTTTQISSSKNCQSEMINESNGPRSPMAVQRHGRPPKNRKVSKVEKLTVKKKGKSEKTKKNKEKKVKDTNTEQGYMHYENNVGALNGLSIQEKEMQVPMSYEPPTIQVSSFQPSLHTIPLPYFHYPPHHNFSPLVFPNSMYNAQGFPTSSQLRPEHQVPYIHYDHATKL